MDLNTIATTAVSIVAGAVAAVVAVRQAAPGMMASLVRRSAEAGAVEKHSIAIVGDDEVARLETYELLTGLGFKSLRCAAREGYERRGKEASVVLVPLNKVEGQQFPVPAFDLRRFAASAGASEGLLYVKGTVFRRPVGGLSPTARSVSTRG